MKEEDIKVILATDCGSTTSKARFFKKIGGEYRFVESGEAPTTVEAPFEDVTLGVKNAVREVEELTGHKLLGEEGIIQPANPEMNEGVDIYVTTSSAGGGLQMSVAGVIKEMTAESAFRAALGAGAIVMDVMAIDDGRRDYEKIQRLRFLRPDMILVAGGTDGGTIDNVVSIAELLAAAEPKPRLGVGFNLPVVYAGNKNAREYIKQILGKKFDLKIVDNIRPTLDMEVTEPARNAIHECFMEHVMSHAPGYDKLMKWTPVPIMPTPAGEGMMFRTIGETYKANVIGVGLGGATTNVYSYYEGRFVRTVSANLGMSYSICNVLKEAGIENIMRWVPFEVDEAVVRNSLRNKMIRPTTIPHTLEDLIIEHAVAREALRLGLEHHKLLARPLRGVRRERDVADILDQKSYTETYIKMMNVDWIGGTGGLLSHAPRRVQSALILIDGFRPEGITRLAQDSVFMMPHLGVLSTVHPKAAMEIFERDCLVRLGTCIAPVGTLEKQKKEIIMKMTIKMPNGEVLEEYLEFGTMKRIPLGENEKAEIEFKPEKGFDMGNGPNKEVVATVEGGVVGIILDGRGRPLKLPEDVSERRKKLFEWFKALNAYPEWFLKKYGGD